MRSNVLTKSGLLIRLNFKRDWFRILIWTLALVGMITAVAAKFTGIYSTTAAINSIVSTLKSPAMVSIFGAFTARKPYTLADVFATEMVVFMALGMAIFNISLAISHARGEEDAGITELVRSHAVGRLAPLAAVALELVLVNLGLGLLFGAGLQLANLTGSDTIGNWLIGFGLATNGLMIGTLALVIAQLASNASGATMGTYLIFGIMYLARMATDVTKPAQTWWVPFGWVEKLSAYQGNHWLPVWLSLIASGVLVLIAAWLNGHRDAGSGLLPSRLGRATASPFLRGSFTLVFRQSRGLGLAWIIGMLVFGASYGSIFNTIGDIAKTNPMITKLLSTSAVHAANLLLVKNFLALIMIVLAVVATIPAVQLALKLFGDERRGYQERLFAAPVARWQLWFSYVGWSLVMAFVVYGAAVLGIGIAGRSVMAHPLAWHYFTDAFWAYLPAILVTVGVAALLVGWLPRARYFVWAWLGYGFYALYLGKLLNVPDWALKLSPFGWINRVPVHSIDLSVTWWLLGLTAACLILSLIGYRQRDLA